MNKAEKIIKQEAFLQYINTIENVEKDRIYCRHGLTHLLDVARIAYIKNLEQGSPYSKEVIYGAALLHDIGKVKQYEERIPHEITGAEKSMEILTDCGYGKEEIEWIRQAILEHRRGPKEGSTKLSWLLYEADKASRACYLCPAAKSCNWSEEQKNKTVVY